MAKIDYDKSMTGEIFPLSYNANEIGHLGFAFNNKPLNVPKLKNKIFAVVTTDVNHQLKFKWKVTPLANDTVLISCTHPITKSTYLLALWEDPFTPKPIVEENALPINEEDVPDAYRFKINFIEGSPLFFEIKAINQCYFTGGFYGAEKDLKGEDYYIVQCWYGDDIKNNMRETGNCFNWFFDVTANTPQQKTLKAAMNPHFLELISKQIGFEINKEYLKKLTT
ncbi:MAG: hypothetical protein EOP00_24810 [Pedobacter sp.]|nr:MAG: hypothetical protein EOP00_24810 [Pedobacter sp.]